MCKTVKSTFWPDLESFLDDVALVSIETSPFKLPLPIGA